MNVTRNTKCHCGSGQRYKHCCGRPASQSAPPMGKDATMHQALAAQKAGQLLQAERLYRSVLDQHGEDIDCMHMLGVVHLQRGDRLNALRHIHRAGTLADWKIPTIWHNLALALRLFQDDPGDTARRWAYQIWYARRAGSERAMTPLVSVIVPAYNHARFVAQAIESVFRQTYGRIELIVIDDGSSDDSAKVIADTLRGSPFPARFIARSNLGAHATINEAISLSSGGYVNVLNSDDLFDARRIETMVHEVARVGAEWGFSGIRLIDPDGQDIPPRADTLASELTQIARSGPNRITLGFGLLRSNYAISSGNLFFSRSLYDALGGFADYRYNHDWDFALRATLECEPVLVSAALYAYRIHARNTIVESRPGAVAEAERMFGKFFATDTTPRNPFAPTSPYWGNHFASEPSACQRIEGAGKEKLLERIAEMVRAGQSAAPGGPVARHPGLDPSPALDALLELASGDRHMNCLRFGARQALVFFDHLVRRLRHASDRPLHVTLVGSTGMPKPRVARTGDLIEHTSLRRFLRANPPGHAGTGPRPIRVLLALDQLGRIEGHALDALWEAGHRHRLDVLALGDVFDEGNASLMLEELRALATDLGRRHEARDLDDLPADHARVIEAGEAAGHRSVVVGQGRLDLWSGLYAARLISSARDDGGHATRALDAIHARFFGQRDFAEPGAAARKYLLFARQPEMASLLDDFKVGLHRSAIPDDDPHLAGTLEITDAIAAFPRSPAASAATILAVAGNHITMLHPTLTMP